MFPSHLDLGLDQDAPNERILLEVWQLPQNC
jgi:hypothetical protein